MLPGNDTLLHVAARANNLKIVMVLLEWGVDPCTKNVNGREAKDEGREDVREAIQNYIDSLDIVKGALD